MIEKLDIPRVNKLPINDCRIPMPKVAPMKQDIKYDNPEIATITIKVYELFNKKINEWFEVQNQNCMCESYKTIVPSKKSIEYILKEIYQEILYNEINRS